MEAALALPILIAIGLIGTDMQRIHVERIRLENASAAMALNLAVQPELSVAGVDALAEAAMQGYSESQHLVILQVQQSGRISWALQRGGAQQLCQPPAAAGEYTDELPEDLPEQPADAAADTEQDASTMSYIVVMACRDTSQIVLSRGLIMPAQLQNISVYRSISQNILLDEILQDESDKSGLAFVEADA